MWHVIFSKVILDIGIVISVASKCVLITILLVSSHCLLYSDSLLIFLVNSNLFSLYLMLHSRGCHQTNYHFSLSLFFVLVAWSSPGDSFGLLWIDYYWCSEIRCWCFWINKIAADVTPPAPVLNMLTLMSYILPEAKLFPQKDTGIQRSPEKENGQFLLLTDLLMDVLSN